MMSVKHMTIAIYDHCEFQHMTIAIHQIRRQMHETHDDFSQLFKLQLQRTLFGEWYIDFLCLSRGRNCASRTFWRPGSVSQYWSRVGYWESRSGSLQGAPPHEDCMQLPPLNTAGSPRPIIIWNNRSREQATPFPPLPHPRTLFPFHPLGQRTRLRQCAVPLFLPLTISVTDRHHHPSTDPTRQNLINSERMLSWSSSAPKDETTQPINDGMS